MPKPILIIFAGVIGTSKTPIAYYLSTALQLPIFNNDAIRTEVIEDRGFFDEEDFNNRRADRLREIINVKTSFIGDFSIDREWKNYRHVLAQAGYSCFIISIDLGRKYIERLYAVKKYDESLQRLDQFMSDHEAFLRDYGADVGLHITDDLFPQRLELSLGACRDWLAKL